MAIAERYGNTVILECDLRREKRDMREDAYVERTAWSDFIRREDRRSRHDESSRHEHDRFNDIVDHDDDETDDYALYRLGIR